MQTAQALAQAEAPHVPAALAPGPQPAMPAAAPAAAQPLPPAGQAEIPIAPAAPAPGQQPAVPAAAPAAAQPLPPAGQAEIPIAPAAPAPGQQPAVPAAAPAVPPPLPSVPQAAGPVQAVAQAQMPPAPAPPAPGPHPPVPAGAPAVPPPLPVAGQAGMPHAPAAPMFPQLLGQQAVGGLLAQMLALPPPPPQLVAHFLAHGYVPPPAGAAAPAVPPLTPPQRDAAAADAWQQAVNTRGGTSTNGYRWNRVPGSRVTRPMLPESTDECEAFATAMVKFFDSGLLQQRRRSSEQTRQTDTSRFRRFIRWTEAENEAQFIDKVHKAATWRDYIAQACRQLGSPASVINDATSIVSGVAICKSLNPAMANVNIALIREHRELHLASVRREKRDYATKHMDRTAQEDAGEMPKGGFTELRTYLGATYTKAVEASTQIENGHTRTRALLNAIATHAIAMLYLNQPTARPGPIANMSLKEATHLIENKQVQLHYTKNTIHHPAALQTANLETCNALQRFKDARPVQGMEIDDEPFDVDADDSPFWITAVGEEGLGYPISNVERWLTDRLKSAFPGSGLNVTPTNIRRLAETVTSEAAVAGVVTQEARDNMLLTQNHSGRVAALHYVKRRRIQAAASAATTLETAIAHEDRGAAANNEQFANEQFALNVPPEVHEMQTLDDQLELQANIDQQYFEENEEDNNGSETPPRRNCTIS